MAEISKITMPSGTTYDIKDAVARQAVAGGVSFLGVSTTAITDGGNQKPTIDGTQMTPINGGMVIYGDSEFIFTGDYNDGGKWAEFGDMSQLGDLAYKDSASGSVVAAGTVSQPTFTGTGVRLVTGNISVPTSASFTGNAMTSTGKFTPSGSVTVTPTTGSVTVSPAASGTATYTPEGSVSQPTFTGDSMTSTGNFTPSGSVTISKGTGTANYTPEGSVSQPTVSIKTAGATTKVKNPTSVTVAKAVVTAAPSATAPSNPVTMYAVEGETLKLYQVGYTTGASITTSEVTVKTGDASYTASQPTFTGTGVQLKGSFSGTQGSVSVSGTPSGSVSKPTFTGTGKRLVTASVATGITSASFTGDEDDVSVSGTPSGSVGLTNSNKTATVTTTSGTATYTPSGTVSQPTFTGSPVSVTVD